MSDSAVTGAAAGTATAGDRPFWFDLWQNRGWSSRVARNWLMDAAFRERDRGYLAIVLPTLAPEQKTYVAGVLSSEGCEGYEGFAFETA